MDISLVIPVSNDSKIDECLKSINKEVETIVVLNKPSKEVNRIIKKWKKKNKKFELKVIKLKNKNVSKARNMGARKTKYNKILFLDSDCTLEKNCLNEINKRLDNYEIVKGKVIIGKREQNILKDDFFTPNLGIRKNVFKKLNGFDEKIKIAEDYELSLRINNSRFSRTQTPKAIVYHPDIRKFFRGIKTFYKLGIGYSVIDRKNKNRNCLKRATSVLGLRKIISIESPKEKFRRFFVLPWRIIGYFYGRIKYKYV